MQKTISYFLVLLVLFGGLTLFFRKELFSPEEVSLEEALIKAEDLSRTDFYVQRQEITDMDDYDLPVSQEISKKLTMHITGAYKQDENRIMFLTSGITKYLGNATPHLEDVKKTIAVNLGNQPLEEFVPEFETSSSYEYRKCAKASSQGEQKAYSMCVIAKIVKENYLFTVVLHGSGTMTNRELENILGTALSGKKEILERLP